MHSFNSALYGDSLPALGCKMVFILFVPTPALNPSWNPCFPGYSVPSWSVWHVSFFLTVQFACGYDEAQLVSMVEVPMLSVFLYECRRHHSLLVCHFGSCTQFLSCLLLVLWKWWDCIRSVTFCCGITLEIQSSFFNNCVLKSARDWILNPFSIHSFNCVYHSCENVLRYQVNHFTKAVTHCIILSYSGENHF